MPQTKVILFKEEDGSVPIVIWLKELKLQRVKD